MARIREYVEGDFKRVAEIYRTAFAEPPWNEFMKCLRCNKAGYGIDEVEKVVRWDRIGVAWEALVPRNGRCKECGTDLSPDIVQCVGGAYAFTNKDFAEFWSEQDVRADMQLAISQQRTIMLVAESESESRVSGFTWGYATPLPKPFRFFRSRKGRQCEFPFLKGRVSRNSVYMDEIAVDPAVRQQGVGRSLCLEFLEIARSMGFEEIVLRTDENNVASMGLFASVGFAEIGKVDKRYPTRTYMKRDLEDLARN